MADWLDVVVMGYLSIALYAIILRPFVSSDSEVLSGRYVDVVVAATVIVVCCVALCIIYIPGASNP